MMGRFFGELSTGRALALFLAPLLCWVSELPIMRKRRPWVISAVQLALVAVPLVIGLGLAKRDFDRAMAEPYAVVAGDLVVVSLRETRSVRSSQMGDRAVITLDLPITSDPG